MNERYLGNEITTSRSQVIRYLTENYTDASGQPVTAAARLMPGARFTMAPHGQPPTEAPS